MATKYTTVSVTGYNANPPPDDGSSGGDNEIRWLYHTEKIGSPLKTAVEAINTKLVSHFDQGPNAVVTNYTLVASDFNKVVTVNGAGITITLPSAAGVGVGYYAYIKNLNASDIVTVATSGGDTIDGQATLVLNGKEFTMVFVSAAGTWITMGSSTFAGVSASTTGEIKIGIFPVAPSGWILLNDGTIGNAGSGATTRANADTQALYTLLWDNIIDAYCPVSGGRGASAAADFGASKTIQLPRSLGRVFGVSGAGSGLTSRALGQFLGEENHILTIAELAAHTHTQETLYGGSGSNFDGGSNKVRTDLPTGSTGSNQGHNTMQPTIFLNAIIKL